MKYSKCEMIHLLAVVAIIIFTLSRADACTGLMFSVVDKPGAAGSKYVFQGRTMEFGLDVTGWRLISVPRGYPYAGCRMGTCGEGVAGIQWTAKYQHVGMSPARPGMPVLDEVTDGINEKGLSCGGFYHMGYEEYRPRTVPRGKGTDNSAR